MCRLLFIESKNEFEIFDHLEKFAEICKKSKEFQGHGWGCSYLGNDGEWKHYKNINPIWEDDFNKFSTTNRLIVHARSAFQDKDINVENNMPFFDDNYIFVFNGELRGVKIKSEGRIGAEKIFNFIKRFDYGDLIKTLEKSLTIIKKRSDYIKAMNIIIADKKNVYLTSIFNEEEDYFTMHYKKYKDGLIICSDPYPYETGWIKIKNNYIGVL